MSAGRGERRRRERAERKHDTGQPVVVVGDSVVGVGLGAQYEARAGAKLRPKVPGEHRFIVTAAWAASDELVATSSDPSVLKFLDAENMLEFGIGCADCEQPLGVLGVGSRCPAPPDQWWR